MGYLDNTGLAYFWSKLKDMLNSKADTTDLPKYATCSTAEGTAAKIATTTGGDFKLATGAMVRVKFTKANTYNGTATLNVDDTGAKSIARVGTTVATRYFWTAGEVVDFVYDGTNYVMSNKGVATTSYYGETKLATSATSTSTTTALTPASLNNFSNGTVAEYPVYSTSSTYAVGDRVRYSYHTYECITAITKAEAWTAAHWKVLPALQGQIDALQDTAEGIESQLPSTIAGYSVNTSTGSMELWSQDLNNITKTGFYNAMTCTNAKYPYSTLIVIGYYLSGYCTQIQTDVTTGAIATRSQINGTWSAWQVIHQGSVAPRENALLSAVDESDNPYNSGKGWKAGYRLGSSGTESQSASNQVTGFIPMVKGQTMTLEGIELPATNYSGYNTCYIAVYKADKTCIKSGYSKDWYSLSGNAPTADSNNHILTITINTGASFVDVSEMAYIRISTLTMTDDSAIYIE